MGVALLDRGSGKRASATPPRKISSTLAASSTTDGRRNRVRQRETRMPINKPVKMTELNRERRCGGSSVGPGLQGGDPVVTSLSDGRRGSSVASTGPRASPARRLTRGDLPVGVATGCGRRGSLHLVYIRFKVVTLTTLFVRVLISFRSPLLLFSPVVELAPRVLNVLRGGCGGSYATGAGFTPTSSATSATVAEVVLLRE